MESPKEQIQHRKGESLSPITAERTAERSPSRSRAASVKSNRSGTTIVEDDCYNGKEEHNSVTQFSRTGTLDITIKPISRLEILYGLLSPERMTRKMAEKAKINGIDNFEYQSNRGSPYLVNVNALSKRKDADGLHVPKLARCTIDTGNHQGNFVSKTFVVEDLEYPESEFLPLNPVEREGGLSASNHKLIPEAAVIITWYHAGSTRLFRNMRFLVMSNPEYHLVIGARSIAKHNILLPPNFQAGRESVQYKGVTDPKATNLKGQMKRHENEIKTLKRELKDYGNETSDNAADIAKTKSKLEKETEKFEKAKKARDEYLKELDEEVNQSPKKDGAKADGKQADATTKGSKSNGPTKEQAANSKGEGKKQDGKSSLFGIRKRKNGGGK